MAGVGQQQVRASGGWKDSLQSYYFFFYLFCQYTVRKKCVRVLVNRSGGEGGGEEGCNQPDLIIATNCSPFCTISGEAKRGFSIFIQLYSFYSVVFIFIQLYSFFSVVFIVIQLYSFLFSCIHFIQLYSFLFSCIHFIQLY